MKKIYSLLSIVLLSSLIPATSFAFANLFCVSDEPLDKTGVVMEEGFECVTAKGHGYSVTFEGYGFAVGGELVTGLSITCPNVRHRALGVESFINSRGKTKKGVMKFVGVKAEGIFLVGATAGVFMNKNGGMCTVEGLSAFGIGGAVDGLVMTIEKH